jgi:DNA-binding transcriptional MerR regulator
MKLLTTSAVAKRLNLSPSRVVQLDREGALRATMRDSAGRRLYEADVVERFAVWRARKRTAQTADNVPQPVAS